MKDIVLSHIQKAQTIVIKVGSARVSGDTKEINDFLYGLTASIRSLRNQGKNVVLVSSGAIAQGKKLYSQNFPDKSWEGIPLNEKQALAAMGQSKLMNLYDSFFSQANIPIAQILFGKNDILSEEGHKNLTNTFRSLLGWGVLPIVNENDSISTDEINLGDNDLLSAMVTSLLGANVLIILTGVDGFFKDNTLVDFMEEISTLDFQHALGPSGPGRGGMNTKLKAGKILLKFGIATCILNGTKPYLLEDLFSGKNPGTLIGKPDLDAKVFPFQEWMQRFNANE